MVGENFEFYPSEMVKNSLKINPPPWLEKIFEIYHSEIAENALKSSIMVGEIF